MNNQTVRTLEELASLVNAKLVGDPDHQITGVGTLEAATAEQVSFLANPIYHKHLSISRAGAVIVSAADADLCSTSALIVDNPYAAFAKIAALFVYKPTITPGIHASATVGVGCDISPSASIGAGCVIGDRVTIGDHVVIGAQASIADGVIIGDNSHLYPRVTIYHQVVLGKRVIVHSGAVLGSDGFGFAL